MRRGVELTKGLFFLLFSLVVCYESFRLPIGRFGKPGPGFFPLLLGIILGVLSLIFLLTHIFGRHQTIAPSSFPRKGKQVLLTLGALILYSALLPFLGYLVSTFVLVFYLLCLTYTQRLLICGILSILISIASYVGFQTILNIQLPHGPLGM